MRRFFLLLAFATLAIAGCQAHRPHTAKNDCRGCGPGGRGQYTGCGVQNSADYVPQIPKHYGRETQPSGPATGSYAYPYYTTRAPRDFLLDQPTTIGY